MDNFSPPVRLSRMAKDQLTNLKRITRLKQWNVLCRWALCHSLADPSRPAEHYAAPDTAIEIDWRTFAGEFDTVYLALLRHRCEKDGLGQSPESLQHELRLHLHRGIASLSGTSSVGSLSDLVKLAKAA